MNRGGHRQGAGRKGGWRQGQTQTIRVPIALKDQILEISRQLDQEKHIYPSTYSALKALIDKWQKMSEDHPSDAAQWQKVRQLIGEIQDLLASESVSDHEFNQLENELGHAGKGRFGKHGRRRQGRNREQWENSLSTEDKSGCTSQTTLDGTSC